MTTWVVTRLCRDCLHKGCVDVCPVDCIYELAGGAQGRFPNQVVIDPKECIACAACEPACPWKAIFRVDAVPAVFQSDIALNARVTTEKDAFRVATKEEKPSPTDAEVAANRAKWDTGEATGQQ
jgi:ferredoxin